MPPIPAAPPPNLVGRHAHMPPWPGRDNRRPWWSRRPCLAGCGRPALRTRLKPRRRGGLYGRPQGSSVSPQACGGPAVRRGRIYNAPLQWETAVRTCRGGLYIRPNRPAVPAAPPPNLVGRHAHMPPWPGRDNRRPWWSRRPCLAGCGRPALRTRLKPRRRGGLYGRPQGSSVSSQACGGPAVRRGRI